MECTIFVHKRMRVIMYEGESEIYVNVCKFTQYASRTQSVSKCCDELYVILLHFVFMEESGLLMEDDRI